MDKEANIEIIVSPKSSRSRIVIEENGIIKVYLNSPPIDGKANQECIKLFSKILKIAKTSIRIDKGEKRKRKRLVIFGITREEVLHKLRMENSN